MSAATHKATQRIHLKRKAIASIPAITPIGSKEPVSVTLPRAVRRIAQTLQPDKIILFGSYAVDIFLKTPDELRAELSKRIFFVHEIVSKGKVLHERPYLNLE